MQLGECEPSDVVRHDFGNLARNLFSLICRWPEIFPTKHVVVLGFCFVVHKDNQGLRQVTDIMDFVLRRVDASKTADQ